MADDPSGPSGAERDRWATIWYRKGVEAMNKQNWPLAIESFAMSVNFKPDNVGFRQHLRGCTRKKYGDNGSGAGALTRAKLMGVRSRIKKARSAENWEDVDKACEEGLLVNPWDVGFNVDLAEACKARGWLEIAVWSYGEARKSDPNNRDINIAFADLLEERGQYDEAVKIWQHLYHLDPKDGQARSKITGLETRATTERGGYDDASNTRDVRVDKQAGAKKGESLAPGQSVETDLKHAIRKDPANKENYLKLAAHYRRNHKIDEAVEQLQQALEVSGNDAAVREILEDVEIDQLMVNLDLAKQAASKSGKDSDRQNAAALAQDLLKREIEVLSARVERYPADLSRKYELALRLMRVQKWTLAIPLLQKSSQDPRIKSKALVALGKCFVYDKKSSLARGQFERALPDLNVEMDKDLFLEAHYLLGRVCEELKDFPAAEQHYGEVLVYDYDYKDARERLENLQQGGGDGAAG